MLRAAHQAILQNWRKLTIGSGMPKGKILAVTTENLKIPIQAMRRVGQKRVNQI
jgi:hypothetical protein